MALGKMIKLDQLKERTGHLKARADQFRSREFADASMAMCALVAAADGSVDPSERERTAALISGNDTLAVFPPHELSARFDRYCDKLNRDFDLGKVEAVAAVAKLARKPDQARAVVSIGLIIGHADGEFDAAERAVVTEACRAAGLPPSDFDL